ncbi:MAG: ribonuclease Z [Methanomassiliicoccales archaeon]
MRIIFLGTAGGLPTPKRSLPATVLQVGPEIILFDCGEGTQRQFMSSNCSFVKVRKIFITHFHGDHFLGLPGLIQSMSFVGREEPLRIFGPPGIEEIVDITANLGYFDPNFDIIAREVAPGETLSFDEYDIKAIEVDHLVPCYGYVLTERARRGRFMVQKAKSLGIPEGPLFRVLQEGESVIVNGKTITPDMVMGPPRKGLKISISGDTKPCEAFADAARNSDIMIHEATLDSSLKSKAYDFGHSTASDAALVALKSGARALYLNHISNRYDNAMILEMEARKIFPNSYVSHDLMEVFVRHCE